MNQLVQYTTRSVSLILTVFATLTLAACGNSGGGGSSSGGGGGGGLPVGTFTKTVDLPGAGGDWTGLFWDGNPGGARYQALVLAQDLNGSGPVNALSFHFAADSTGNSCPNVTIKMGHTSVTTLDTTFANNVEQGSGSLVTVFGTATLDIPSGAIGDYFTIPLNGAFYYNGMDNLVLDITTGGCTDRSELAANEATASYTALIWDANDSTALIGSIWNALAHMQFVFAGGDNPVTYTGTQFDWRSPFRDDPGAINRIQTIYPASDVNGSGPITGIAIPINATTAASSFTVTAKLGHFTATELTSNLFPNNYSDNPVTVVDAATFSVPAGVPTGDYVWLPLNGDTFTYNGVDSLVMEIEVSSPTGSIAWIAHRTPGTKTVSFGSLFGEDSFDAKFRFYGGTMDVLTSGDAFDAPFNDTVDHVLQLLYGANDLGTDAQIDKIAFRLSADSIAEDYTGFSVVLGHTTNTTLSATLADNFDDSTNVFSGTMNIPAGLKAGDWVEIPVSGFNYNSLKNLVVQVTTNMGTGGNTNNIFAGNRVISGAGAASIGSPTFDIGTDSVSAALRLSYTK